LHKISSSNILINDHINAPSTLPHDFKVLVKPLTLLLTQSSLIFWKIL